MGDDEEDVFLNLEQYDDAQSNDQMGIIDRQVNSTMSENAIADPE